MVARLLPRLCVHPPQLWLDQLDHLDQSNHQKTKKKKSAKFIIFASTDRISQKQTSWNSSFFGIFFMPLIGWSDQLCDKSYCHSRSTLIESQEHGKVSVNMLNLTTRRRPSREFAAPTQNQNNFIFLEWEAPSFLARVNVARVKTTH